MRVAWLSVDPVRPMVNFYPKTMAIRLEAALKANAGKCELGADFYNATVHFYTSDGMVQTTKAQGMGRHGYKPPGYRSVRRVEIFEESDRALKIFSRRKGYEWRIVNTEAEAEHAFQETVPEEVLISADALPVESLELQAWSGDDLVASGSAAADKPVVIWQWCRGTEEEHGDSLLHLSDHMWCPYAAPPATSTPLHAWFSGASNVQTHLAHRVTPVLGPSQIHTGEQQHHRVGLQAQRGRCGDRAAGSEAQDHLYCRLDLRLAVLRCGEEGARGAARHQDRAGAP